MIQIFSSIPFNSVLYFNRYSVIAISIKLDLFHVFPCDVLQKKFQFSLSVLRLQLENISCQLLQIINEHIPNKKSVYLNNIS